jgi:hypothetical protein
MKERRLESLLRAAMGRRAPRVLPMLAMPVGRDGMPWGFRHKVAFVFGSGADGRELVMGHFGRGTGRIVPVQECPVHSERGNRIAFALRAPLRALLGSSDRPDGLLLNIHDRPGPYMVGRETRRVAGREHVVEDALGPEFLASPRPSSRPTSSQRECCCGSSPKRCRRSVLSASSTSTAEADRLRSTWPDAAIG